MLQTLRGPVLHETIQRQVKDYIVARGMRPGDRLPTEEQISREIGAGRNVVREALRGLETLGLVEARQGDGRFVREFTFDAVLDNLPYAMYLDRNSYVEQLEVRAELETGFVGRASRLLDADDLEHLHRSCAALCQKTLAGQPALDEDMAFHRRIFHRLDNHVLARLLDVFWATALARMQSGLPVRMTDDERLAMLDNHRVVQVALERRDPMAATTAMRTHFDLALARVGLGDRAPAELATTAERSQ